MRQSQWRPPVSAIFVKGLRKRGKAGLGSIRDMDTIRLVMEALSQEQKIVLARAARQGTHHLFLCLRTRVHDFTVQEIYDKLKDSE
uniref:40S ribosomal protein S18 n=1 Tax=Haemonchus contortus TaxID=6289 RepID=A0A7I4YFI3_HAECO